LHHGRRAVRRHRAGECCGDGVRLGRAGGEQHEVPRLEDGAEPLGDRMRGHRVTSEGAYDVAGTVLTLVSSIPVAYALAHFRFRGRRLAMMMVIATMMLPPQVVIIPMYLVWGKQLHLTGTLWPLIVPLGFGDAFSIFLLRQFLVTVPREYMDAAKVDGASELQVLCRVVLPMCRPAIAAVSLFQFFYCWNDYFGPQIYASENPGAWTLSYGLSTFKSAHHTNWNFTMAATLLVMAPVIALFFLAQKAFIEGVTLTGVKG
jgi:multiple sugar transport system permease protein